MEVTESRTQCESKYKSSSITNGNHKRKAPVPIFFTKSPIIDFTIPNDQSSSSVSKKAASRRETSVPKKRPKIVSIPITSYFPDGGVTSGEVIDIDVDIPPSDHSVEKVDKDEAKLRELRFELNEVIKKREEFQKREKQLNNAIKKLSKKVYIKSNATFRTSEDRTQWSSLCRLLFPSSVKSHSSIFTAGGNSVIQSRYWLLSHLGDEFERLSAQYRLQGYHFKLSSVNEDHTVSTRIHDIVDDENEADCLLTLSCDNRNDHISQFQRVELSEQLTSHMTQREEAQEIDDEDTNICPLTQDDP